MGRNQGLLLQPVTASTESPWKGLLQPHSNLQMTATQADIGYNLIKGHKPETKPLPNV